MNAFTIERKTMKIPNAKFICIFERLRPKPTEPELNNLISSDKTADLSYFSLLLCIQCGHNLGSGEKLDFTL